MRRPLIAVIVALILAVGVLAPPALAQANSSLVLFVEIYQLLRDEALSQPSSEVLLQGAEAGLRRLLQDEGQPATQLGALRLTGDERADLTVMMRRIEQVQATVRARPATVVHAAAAAMVAALRDPNSVFYPPDQFAQFVRRTTTGEEFVGIGIVLEERGGQPVIMEVLDSSPASEGGLRGGDVIMAVGGTSTAGLSLEQVSQLIRGSAGTDVVLRVQRQGQADPVTVTLTRRRIAQRVVSTRMLPSGIGYLRLTQFTENSADLVGAGLTTLLEQGAKGMVFDLRGNPGGLLDASINIASHFLERGVVVTLESGRRPSTSFTVRPRSPKYTGPLVLLVDRGSASASEVVAGALQDAGTRLVGTRTYGKATVQQVHPFRDGSGMRVTVSRYLTPAGRNIEGQGLSPDIEVSTSGVPIGSPEDAPLNTAVSLLQQQSASNQSGVLPRAAGQ